MSKNSEKKRLMLPTYKKNAAMYCKGLLDKFLCPICLNFVEDNEVSIAALVPKCITGKEGFSTLTCIPCNNLSGYQNEAALQREFKRRSGEHKGNLSMPGCDGRASIVFKHHNKPNGSAEIRIFGGHPILISQMQNALKEKQTFTFNLELVVSEVDRNDKKSIYMSAYLTLFKYFGYEILTMNGLHDKLIVDPIGSDLPIICGGINGQSQNVNVLMFDDFDAAAVSIKYDQTQISVVIPGFVPPYEISKTLPQIKSTYKAGIIRYPGESSLANTQWIAHNTWDFYKRKLQHDKS